MPVYQLIGSSTRIIGTTAQSLGSRFKRQSFFTHHALQDPLHPVLYGMPYVPADVLKIQIFITSGKSPNPTEGISNPASYVSIWR